MRSRSSSCPKPVAPGDAAATISPSSHDEQSRQQRDLVVLVAEVDGDDPALRHRAGPLEGGDRLADAGLSAEQHHFALTDPSRQHVVERSNPVGSTACCAAAR